MRKTKLTFFLIGLLLVGTLAWVMLGEMNASDLSVEDITQIENNPPLSQNDDMADELTTEELSQKYQSEVVAILHNWRQQILQQSVAVDEGVRQIRERLLEITFVPKQWQGFHLQLVLALDNQVEGNMLRARSMYESLIAEAQWLKEPLNFLIGATQ
ncbi:MAG: hypothetical protein NUV82_03595 [Candidatus Komeilibacteria bacterium]|nr:hypothetical protein [Candidatus Komeilibacteria bacterium]